MSDEDNTNSEQSSPGTPTPDKNNEDGVNEKENKVEDGEIEITKTEDKVSDGQQQEATTNQDEGRQNRPGGNRDLGRDRQVRDTNPTTVTPTSGSTETGGGDPTTINKEQPAFRPKGPGFQHSIQRHKFKRDEAKRT